jgi:hypothetical protein
MCHRGSVKFWRKAKFFVLSALKHKNLARRINTVLSFIAIVIIDFKLTGLYHFPFTTVTQFSMQQPAKQT